MRDQLAKALRRLLDQYDPEAGSIYAAPEPSCNVCTLGTTPVHMDKGLCPMHEAEATLRAHFLSRHPERCPSCDRPSKEVAYGGHCIRGGCPLGGDL